MTLRGRLPSPRVMLLGRDAIGLAGILKDLGATLVERMTSPDEVDLVIGDTSGVQVSDTTDVIMLSPTELCDPCGRTILVGGITSRREFLSCDVPGHVEPVMNRLVEYYHKRGVKGLQSLHVLPSRSQSLIDMQVLLKTTGDESLFVYFANAAGGRRVLATVPKEFHADWTTSWMRQWSATTPAKYPLLSDWGRTSRWATAGESKIYRELERLELDRREFINDSMRRQQLATERLEAEQVAGDTQRILLSGQGEALVQAAIMAFRRLGFGVRDMDAENTTGTKLEDLRLTDAAEPSWEAIVEVRGYARAGAKESDFTRIHRFASRYRDSESRWPSTCIYLVNHQFELPPEQRVEVFVGADEAVREFANAQGLIIWTGVLYQLVREVEGRDDAEVVARIRREIRSSTGVLRIRDVGAAET